MKSKSYTAIDIAKYISALLVVYIHTFPLAGTRPRGKTPEEDAELERSLLADPKELSEHNMLVDLGRNDIGRLSKFGTVEVEKYIDRTLFTCHAYRLYSQRSDKR